MPPGFGGDRLMSDSAALATCSPSAGWAGNPGRWVGCFCKVSLGEGQSWRTDRCEQKPRGGKHEWCPRAGV